MTIRISDFSDSVTSQVTPSTNIPTGPAGADGAPGRAFQVDEFINFTETIRTKIETYGTPGSTDPNPNHGLVTSINPYVIVIENDTRTTAQRSAGPSVLNLDVTRHVLEWSGKTPSGGGLWFDYGVFTGMAGANGMNGTNGSSATIAVNSTTTLAAGVDATVANSGTTSAASLDFGIPAGVAGATGPAGSGIASLYPNGNATDAMVGDYTTSGTIGLTISTAAADAISGTTFKITGATTGAKLISPEIDIPLGFRAGLMSLLFVYRSLDADQIKINITDENGVLITSSENLINSQSSSEGSGSFNFAFNVLDNDKIKVEWEATGSVTEFLFDDVTITPDPLLTLPQTTFTLSGGNNALSLDKYTNVNDNAASRSGAGTTTQTATLTEDTDYVDGGDWIESVVTDSQIFISGTLDNDTGFMRYTITAKASAFDASNTDILPVIELIINSTVATTRNVTGGDSGFTITSKSFVGGKLVIVIGSTFTGQLNSSATIGTAEFAITVTKTAGFGAATLVPSTTQTVVTYNQFVNKENVFSARIAGVSNATPFNPTSQSSSFIDNITRASEGSYTVTFVSGFFSVAPSVLINTSGNAGTSAETSVSMSGFTYLTREVDETLVDVAVDIIVQRQGTDYQPPVQTGTFLLSPENIEIMNNQVSGNFSALTIGTNLFSLGMNKAIENYTIDEFSITITNEAATTGSGTLQLILQKKTNGLGNTGWTDISTITTTLGTGVVTGTLDMDQVNIPKGSYVRIVPVTFKTDQESFHLFVQGARSNG